MAALSFEKIGSRKRISEAATPKAVRDAILRIFGDCKEGVWLVGGTALAGYYAEHRSSDDIDLFVNNENSHKAVILSVRTLQASGALFSKEMQTPQFFRTDVSWQGHKFTIDVVLDENIHRIGQAQRSDDGVLVADLRTLFAMKAACLVSRASEKDLFDLDWIFAHAGEPGMKELIAAGNQIDGGLTVETLLISLKGATLRKEACHFLLPSSDTTPAEVFHRIDTLRNKLVHSLLEYERSLPVSSDAKKLAKAVRFASRFK